MPSKTFAIALMDPPYESENHDCLPHSERHGSTRTQHQGVRLRRFWLSPSRRRIRTRHGKNVAEETTPRPRTRSRPCWRSPRRTVARSTGELVCVDERGVGEFVADAAGLAGRFPRR
jgi:hypothetical protein